MKTLLAALLVIVVLVLAGFVLAEVLFELGGAGHGEKAEWRSKRR